MIIDAHSHCDIKFGWKHLPEDIIEMMKTTGIDKAVITTYGDFPGEEPAALERLYQNLKKYPYQFIGGFIRINPWYGEKAVELLVNAVKEHSIKGLKIHPVSAVIWPNHPLTLSLLKKAAELNVPAYIHSGDDPMSLPLHIERAAKECPETIILMGHFGGFHYYNDAIKVAKKYRNVLLETSGMPFPKVIRKAIDILGPERIVFGSDMPGLHPAVELAKIKAAELTGEEEELILCKNIAGILSIKGV
jgi:hypothetical protein